MSFLSPAQPSPCRLPSMNKEEAEVEIVRLVTLMDKVRLEPSGRARRAKEKSIDQDIIKLKAITGPRHITGTSKLGE